LSLDDWMLLLQRLGHQASVAKRWVFIKPVSISPQQQCVAEAPTKRRVDLYECAEHTRISCSKRTL
jgi:hypothetical protein